MYTSIHINCSEDQAEIISSLLLDQEFTGTSFENGVLIAYSKKTKPDLTTLNQLLIQMDLSINEESTLADQNWNELWESNFHDLMVEDKIHVRAPFHESRVVEHEIIIHPKMAFGTGHHGTTQLMLKAILDLDIEDKAVLDMGCGSGILAILASQKGANSVLAIDHDINSTTNCTENVQLNGIENVDIKQADNLDQVTSTFDIILSNIVKNINLSLVPSYSQKLKAGGTLVLCGLLIKDEKEAIDLCAALNLKFSSKSNDGEWLQLNFTKTS